jgi:TRAP-type C4-dicarboxylate transport system permease small subunit
MNVLVRKFVDCLHWLENATLVTAFVGMLCLAVMQIVLRNFFEAGVIWADSLLRMLILWIALLGAMVATRERNHINIDAISRYFPTVSQKLIDSVVALLSALICATAGWYAYLFVRMEFEDQSMAFAAVPTWTTEVIIPLAFFVMAIRFAIQVVTNWAGRKP